MAAGLVLTVAQTLFAALQCQEVRELCSTFADYQSKLGKLQNTVDTIKAVLLEADSKHQELTHEGRVWFEKLKDAVYDADDFFVELTTIAQLKSLSQKKISEKVRRFFCTFNTSRQIKKLREKLDGIAEDRRKFGFSGEYRPVKRRVETCSFVCKTDVIGREAEMDEIVGKLLSNSDDSVSTQKNVSFLSIVGIGGLGKTTLARLIFNDKRIKEAFGEDLYWVCVSEEFGLKEILSKFPNIKSETTLQDIQEQVLKRIGGKKYLLVLDDVWEESHFEWLELNGILGSGGAGSQILVTTRSNKVAKAVDKDVAVHELQGLSEENSWQLFKKIAFGQGDDHETDTHLVEIGRDIMKKCANVPLAIKVTSSLLYCQDKSKWEEYRSRDLANMSCHAKEDPIMSTLMFSYYNLTPELKSCFSFCSLFPKDYVIKKQVLTSLWLAQGYLVPPSKGESMEDVGEEYFSILLQRCFFQDVELDDYGEIHSCKMHDLMHDLAQDVAGKELLQLTASSDRDALQQKLRHLSATRGASIDDLSSKNCPARGTLRTFFQLVKYQSVNFGAAVSNCRRLRVLHLNNCHIPDELGNLLHLRYLDLSHCSSLEMLLKSITKLHNLQILKFKCRELTELPKDIGKLVNLRMLDIHRCSKLKELPEDIGKLVNLRMLDIHGCSGLKELPEDVGKLVNLRMLDMHGCSKLEKFLEEIGKLVNLRLLDLHGCSKLKELPKDMGKLVNLRTLNVHESPCLKQLSQYKNSYVSDLYFPEMRKLTHMPAGIYNLRKLHTLTYFVVGGDSSIGVPRGELTDLKSLVNLRGHLRIEVGKFSLDNMPTATKGADILRKAHLKSLEIMCECGRYVPFDQGEYHETLLEGLCPSKDLSLLVMNGYQGIKFPNWGSNMIAFPAGIVTIVLFNCDGLIHLSSLSKLVCLKYVHLCGMDNLEYIESNAASDGSETFFPSLEKLTLKQVKKLKGWWRDITWKEKEAGTGSSSNGCLVDDNGSCVEVLPSFPRLRELEIKFCESLKYLPPCPHVKKLEIWNVNEAFSFAASSISKVSSSGPSFFCLEELKIRDAVVFNALFRESSVRYLSISNFFFRSLSRGGLEYLTNLQSLKIERCTN